MKAWPVVVALILSTAALPRAAAAEPFLLPADRQGGWTDSDKTFHAAGSFAMAASLRVTGRDEAASVAGAMAVGVVKEIYDATLKPRRHGRGASWKDLVADLVGAAAGAYLITVLEE